MHWYVHEDLVPISVKYVVASAGVAEATSPTHALSVPATTRDLRVSFFVIGFSLPFIPRAIGPGRDASPEPMLMGAAGGAVLG
jgi:hypothetical protein